MTAPSGANFTTCSDTAWFEIKPDGSLYLCWDYTPMRNAADHADGTYDVKVSGLDRDSQVAEVVVSGQEDLRNSDYMAHEKEGKCSITEA